MGMEHKRKNDARSCARHSVKATFARSRPRGLMGLWCGHEGHSEGPSTWTDIATTRFSSAVLSAHAPNASATSGERSLLPTARSVCIAYVLASHSSIHAVQPRLRPAFMIRRPTCRRSSSMRSAFSAAPCASASSAASLIPPDSRATCVGDGMPD